MSNYRTLDDIEVSGKRVLLRVDLNVPMKDGKVTDATRIERVAPTIKELSSKGAKVVLLAHYGRPKGSPNPEMSLKPVADAVGKLLGKDVAFAEDCVGNTASMAINHASAGDIVLLENTRFHAGEEKNDPDFARTLAENGDIYVNDAFSAAHRAHASSEGLAHILPAAAGRAMEAELKALASALTTPERPVLAVVGGAKISTKLELLNNLLEKVDVLVIGGAMANTFLAAQGKPVGKSLCEHEMIPTAQEIMAAAEGKGCEIMLPLDVVVAKEFKAGADHRTIGLNEVAEDEMILDIGEHTITGLIDKLATVKTVVWNGPFGAFELDPFHKGTFAAAHEVARLSDTGQISSVAGCGDTLAALNQAYASQHFTYVSTAGGAFLEWLEGKTLPGVAALDQTH